MQLKGRHYARRDKPRKEVKQWAKPPPGWVKLNVDGSWVEEGLKGGTGMILRDEEGSILVAACRHLGMCASPLEAETQAGLDGVERLLEWMDKLVILESDCQELVSMLNDADINRSPVAGLVNVLKEWCVEKKVRCVRHVSRDLNSVSHILARIGCTTECTRVWIRDGPDLIRDACKQDNTPLP
jgi:ribonuclease HI